MKPEERKGHTMKQNVLKAVKKINRKPLKHAKRAEIMADKFENLAGPIETQHY